MVPWNFTDYYHPNLYPSQSHLFSSKLTPPFCFSYSNLIHPPYFSCLCMSYPSYEIIESLWRQRSYSFYIPNMHNLVPCGGCSVNIVKLNSWNLKSFNGQDSYQNYSFFLFIYSSLTEGSVLKNISETSCTKILSFWLHELNRMMEFRCRLLNSPVIDLLTEVKAIQFGDIIVDELSVQFLLDSSW